MGVTDYVLESFYDLIVEGSETVFDSDSGTGRHHPSCECFMAETRDGHIKSVHGGEVAPSNGYDNEVERGARALHME